MSRQSLQQWVKMEEKLKQAVASRDRHYRKGRKIKKMSPMYPLLEEQLLSYLQERRSQGQGVTGKMLQRKAITLFPTLYPDVEKFVASNGFLEKFMRRNGLAKRAVTSVGQKIPPDAPELIDLILNDFAFISGKYDIIMNMDETPMYFDLPANSTIDFKGLKSIQVKTTGYEKLRYTVLLTAGVIKEENNTYRGFRLPPLVIFKNLKKPPSGNFPSGMVVLGSKGGSMKQEFMLSSYIPKILSRRPGAFFSSHNLSTLLIMDSATSHTTDNVSEALEHCNIKSKIINGGLTPLIQFLDTHVNKSFKSAMREKWEDWVENGEVEYTKSGKRKSASYQMICEWVEEVWKKIKPEFIVRGFKENGYIEYDHDINVLHSRLEETLRNRKVPSAVIDEVDSLIKEFSFLDESHESDDNDNIKYLSADMPSDVQEDDEQEDSFNNLIDDEKEEEEEVSLSDDSNSVDVDGYSDEDAEIKDKLETSSIINVTDDNESDVPPTIIVDDTWICNEKYKLTLKEKRILHSDLYFNDTIMDAAQRIICETINTTFQTVLHSKNPDRFVESEREHLQLLNNNKKHWFLAGSFNNIVSVSVYDSFTNELSATAKECIKSLFSFARLSNGRIPVRILNLPKQTDGNNCGAYAIAYAADIMSGTLPGLVYDPSKLRSHLVECLHHGSLTPFPKLETRKDMHDKIVVEVVEV